MIAKQSPCLLSFMAFVDPEETGEGGVHPIHTSQLQFAAQKQHKHSKFVMLFLPPTFFLTDICNTLGSSYIRFREMRAPSK